MGTRRSDRAMVAVAVVGTLLMITQGAAAVGSAPAPGSDGVAAVIARYRAMIPTLIA
jgi:hypothetical protein